MAAPTALPESTFTVVWMTLCLVLLFGMLVSDKVSLQLNEMTQRRPLDAQKLTLTPHSADWGRPDHDVRSDAPHAASHLDRARGHRGLL